MWAKGCGASVEPLHAAGIIRSMFIRLILLATLLTACTTTPTGRRIGPTATLRALPTARPLPVAPTLPSTATSTLIPPPTAIPEVLPPPTPIAYVVQSGDTLIGIAVRFNVTLEALEASNVGLNPNVLQPGQTIFIPPGAMDSAAPLVAPTLEALAFTVGDFNCTPTPSATTLCFGEFLNQTDQPVVNLVVQVKLGDQIATAYTPLDLILPGVAAPLSAMFPASNIGRAGATVTQADSGAGLADRFVTLTVNDLHSVIGAGSVIVSGSVTNPAPVEVKAAALIATVYNSSGAVRGYRKTVLPEPIPPQASRPFSIALPGVTDIASWAVVAQGRTR